MNEEFSRKRLLQGIIFTLLITFATGMGNVLSAFFMLNVKKQEVEDTQLAKPDAGRQSCTVSSFRKAPHWLQRLYFGPIGAIPITSPCMN